MTTDRAERADLFATIRAAAAADGPCTLTYPQVNVLQRLLVQMLELLDDYRAASSTTPGSAER